MASLLQGPWRGLSVALVAGFLLFAQMASPGHLPHGALVGGALLLVAVAGLLHGLGLLRAGGDALPWQQTTLGALPGERRLLAPLPALGVGLLLLVLLTATLGAAFAWLPILLALAFLLPAASRRPGLLLLVLFSAVQLPLLGGFGLWDPWETHYGEVAREMLARDDWISPWWAQDGWFWSKPVLVFWLEALAWSASGIDFLPDTRFQHTEWVLRLPHYGLALIALGSVYRGVARVFSPRAGLLAGIVLGTTPYFAFLTRQAVTDMPLVALLTVAVMCLLLAFAEDGDTEVRVYRVGPFGVSLTTLVAGLLLVTVVPQVLYLLSRNVSLIDGYLFSWHGDQLVSGSGLNAGVPGNEAARPTRPFAVAYYAQPAAQALLWTIGSALALFFVARERRVRPLRMQLFYLCCALSFMAKGLPGIALPGLVALMALLVTGRWSLLFAGQLRVAQGILLIGVTSLPWFVAMYVRHGPRFTNRLFIHDHINRLTRGVHGDKGSIQYFIEQLGYGMFPWVALVPAGLALAWGASRLSVGAGGGPGDGADEARRREVAVIVGLWFAATFTLFSAMTTKFHHYIFPAVPPLAILVGLVLDRLLGAPAPAAPATPVRAALRLSLLGLSAAALTLGAAALRGDPRGVAPRGVAEALVDDWTLMHPWPAWASGLSLLLGLSLLALVVRRGRAPDGAPAPAPLPAGLPVALLAGVGLLAFVGRDLSWDTGTQPEGPERLIQLFIYNYTRDYPAHIDHRAILSGFAIVAGVLSALAAFRLARREATAALVALSLLFSTWMVDVYMIDLTPHWTQARLVARYYARREGPHEPLLAWQMNWKGENYYTGNRVFAFQPLDNKAITKWIEGHTGTTAYFVLEHKRLRRLRKLLEGRKVHELSGKRECNKFVLVRATL